MIKGRIHSVLRNFDSPLPPTAYYDHTVWVETGMICYIRYGRRIAPGTRVTIRKLSRLIGEIVEIHDD